MPHDRITETHKGPDSVRRRPRHLPLLGVTIVALASVLFACSTAQPQPETISQRPTFDLPAGSFNVYVGDKLRTDVDVPFTRVVQCGLLDCTVPLDVLAPEGATSMPTVVIVPGGPVEFYKRRYLDTLALGIARKGAVVFLMSYRSTVTGNEEQTSLEDIRCSVRYARSVTGRYGGDPHRVVLVGHTEGSELALQVAVRPETDTPGCLAGGNGIPEAVVALAGFRLSPTGAADRKLLILLAGGVDRESEGGPATAELLRSWGFQAEYREFIASHRELKEPSVVPGVVDLIFEAASRSAPTSG